MSAAAQNETTTPPATSRQAWGDPSPDGQGAQHRPIRRLLARAGGRPRWLAVRPLPNASSVADSSLRAATPEPAVDLLVGARTTVRLPRSHAVRSARGLTSFVGLLSVTGALLESNDTASTRPELSACDAIGLPFWDAACWSWSPVVQDRLRAALACVVAGATVRCDETALVRRNELITVDLAWAPLVRAGVVTAVVCSAIDLSRHRAAVPGPGSLDGRPAYWLLPAAPNVSRAPW